MTIEIKKTMKIKTYKKISEYGKEDLWLDADGHSWAGSCGTVCALPSCFF